MNIIDSFGHIDILVNCAGIQRRMTVLEATVEGWEQVINTNLRSAYFMTQAVGKVMVEQRRGKVISIASMTAYRGFHMTGQTIPVDGGLLVGNPWPTTKPGA